VCAVAAERDALGVLDADVLIAGVGPAAAASAASAALAVGDYDLVLSAGVGGGFAPLVPGDVAVASLIAFADLGAETATGFLELGFGSERYPVEPKLAVELADRTGGHIGTALTVATVTGTARRAEALLGRFPDAVSEGMEGAGVAAAAVRHGVAFAEVRAISNVVGPRDRDAWQLPRALESLRQALVALTS
jgi:futalosine hydrolase